MLFVELKLLLFFALVLLVYWTMPRNSQLAIRSLSYRRSPDDQIRERRGLFRPLPDFKMRDTGQYDVAAVPR